MPSRTACAAASASRCARPTCRAPTCLYSPRNKILATSLLIEAFLYEEQTRRGVSIKHWDELSDVADHCTVCHKCDVALPGRHRFRRRVHGDARSAAAHGQEALQSGHRRVDVLPERHEPADHQARAQGDDRLGLQGAAAGEPRAETLAAAQTKRPPATTGKPPIKEQVIHFVNKRMPGGLPKRTARALLDIEDRNYVPIIRDPRARAATPRRCSIFRAAARSACSPRSASPRRPCCGTSACRPCCRPAICAAATRSAARANSTRREKIITDNRVLFHRVANTLNYLDIKTVIVSCGTCFDQLQGYEFDQIFPGCRILDIHEYLMEKGVQLERHGRALHVSRSLPFRR